jgi:hypothetical protein
MAYAAVIAIKHVCFNVNKFQITQTLTLIFDLIEKVIYVFLRYNGNIAQKKANDNKIAKKL